MLLEGRSDRVLQLDENIISRIKFATPSPRYRVSLAARDCFISLGDEVDKTRSSAVVTCSTARTL